MILKRNLLENGAAFKEKQLILGKMLEKDGKILEKVNQLQL